MPKTTDEDGPRLLKGITRMDSRHMIRTSIAGLLAAPLLLAIPTQSQANPPGPCFSHYGCGGTCVSWFSKLHQHGPLFNYGPYYGYPPFEPYGPWDAYLRYNPWYNQGYGHGHHGHCWKLGGRSCGLGGGCGWHAAWGAGGWFKGHGCHGCNAHNWPGPEHRVWFTGQGLFGHKCKPSCATNGCTSEAPACGSKPTCFDAEKTNPVTRYAGVGSVEDTAVFYAGLPTLDPTAPGSIIPAGQ